MERDTSRTTAPTFGLRTAVLGLPGVLVTCAVVVGLLRLVTS